MLRKSLHVERFNYHITTQPTPRLRDMRFSRRTHTQLKNEHDTKSHMKRAHATHEHGCDTACA